MARCGRYRLGGFRAPTQDCRPFRSVRTAYAVFDPRAVVRRGSRTGRDWRVSAQVPGRRSPGRASGKLDARGSAAVVEQLFLEFLAPRRWVHPSRPLVIEVAARHLRSRIVARRQPSLCDMGPGKGHQAHPNRPSVSAPSLARARCTVRPASGGRYRRRAVRRETWCRHTPASHSTGGAPTAGLRGWSSPLMCMPELRYTSRPARSISAVST